ncbi:MAG: dihydroorotase [bacterium]
MSHFFDPKQQPVLVKNVRAVSPADNIDAIGDVLILEDKVVFNPATVAAGTREIDGRGKWLTPGLVDLQVHFREPGFEHKETIATGSRAAFAGGVTSVVVMPNTRPTLDTAAAVTQQMELGKQCHGVNILVAAAATRDIAGHDLTDIASLKAAGAVAITDDGFPLADSGVMRRALEACAQNNLLFMQHAEDPTLSNHGVMTAGVVSEKLGVPGQSADAEGVMVERDVALAVETGARYHVLHMSTARSLRAVKAARERGGRVTCETSPHHLMLTDEACADANTNFKMNPPLRAESDRLAMVEGLADGTIDAVATDHAPHAADEKARGFSDAPFGVIGLETAFATVLHFFHEGVISRSRAVELMTAGPARVLDMTGEVGSFARGDAALIDPTFEWTVTQDDLHGKQTNSSFLGHSFRGRVLGTWQHGALRFAATDELI